MKKISNWLIIVGIVIISIPIAGTLYTNYQQDKLYEEYLNSQDLKDSLEDLDTAFTASPAAITPASVSTEATKPAVEVYKPTVIGRIKIPGASINLLLVEGSTSKDL